MKKSEKTKKQFLFTISLLTMAGFIIAAVSIFFLRKVHNIYNVSSAFHSVNELYNKVVQEEQYILHNGMLDAEFAETGETYHIENFQKYLQALNLKLKDLAMNHISQDFRIDAQVNNIYSELSKYETIFTIALNKAQVKDYSDFENSLKIRKHSHQLELNASQIGLENIFTIQKLERNFILQKDPISVIQLEKKLSEINNAIWKKKNLSVIQKVSLAKALNDYKYSFLHFSNVADTDSENDKIGLMNLLTNSRTIINNQFTTIEKGIEKKEKIMIRNIEITFMIIILNIVAITTFSIVVLLRKPKKVAKVKKQETKTQVFTLQEEVYEVA